MDGWTTLLYALLPHPDQALVLMQNVSGKIALPRRSYDDRVWVGDTRVLHPLLEELTGVPINILRYIGYHPDEEMRQLFCIHLLELHGEKLPPDGLWLPPEKILEDSDLPPALQERLNHWQHEQSSGIIAERRAPWAISGWHAEVERWIVSQILRLGRGAIQKIEPIKSWSISCVLKVVTETGDLYFKASRDLPLFVNEGVVSVRLAELFPDRLPVPVALASERGWMLLDDFGHPLGRDAALDQQAQFMQDFARMQIDSSRKIEELLAAGCKDRRLETLPSQIELLFDDELVLHLLTLEEREKLKPITPRLRTLIAELVALPIPTALLHGDLHAGNVVLQKNSFLYFDWTDAAVSHPFFDMIHIFMEEDEIKRNVLQEAYLLVWEEYYPKADVRRAWELASALYGLYHAVSYQYIVNGIEELVQPELNYGYFFLRKLLEGLQRLDSN
jgi:phosphotransferase family enzyme